MIFVSVGTQLGFDRMVSIVEKWASENKNEEIFCQTGKTSIKLKYCLHKDFVTPKEYLKLIEKCDVLVAHAGIGSILSAMEYEKPIIIFPRNSKLKEHRNNHQYHTAKRFEGRQGIYVAYDEKELYNLLNTHDNLIKGDNIEPYAEESLLNAVKDFIDSK